ncbi:MAG: CPBP family intramembrane metalloprotease [Muribaculaceae bacterium]|nr:CPBP family intramembrane metalloprotease [Muribaculaceae bacterium]
MTTPYNNNIVPVWRKFLLLAIVFVGGLFLTSIVLQGLQGMPLKPQQVIAVALQNVLVFLAPACVVAFMYYHPSTKWLKIDRCPSWAGIAVVVAMALVSLPAMNYIVYLNEHMALPAWLSGVEQWMRETEDAARQTTDFLLGSSSVGMLLVIVLVVGLLTGLCEEFFFRGGILNIMLDSRLGRHAAVWIAALVFSALHMQFFGFVPRLLLGAWFGYLFVWSRSLWLPVIAHALNNTIVVVATYLTRNSLIDTNYAETIGCPEAGNFPMEAVVSAVLTIALVFVAKRVLTHRTR